MKSAHQAKMEAKKPEFIEKFERFTNDDYKSLITMDFRSIRYKKKNVFSDDSDTADQDYFKEKDVKS